MQGAGEAFDSGRIFEGLLEQAVLLEDPAELVIPSVESNGFRAALVRLERGVSRDPCVYRRPSSRPPMYCLEDLIGDVTRSSLILGNAQ